MGLTRIRAEQISDIDYKQAVRVITLTNITLSGGAPSVVDGVSLMAGDRILVNGQSNAAQNGLYQVQTLGTGENGTWTRTSDANQDGEIQPGMIVMVTQGNQYADTPWKLITNGEIIIGTTELTFTENYSLAFGNIFANGTAVIANVVSAPITFVAGANVSIIGNNTTKTVTISAAGGGGGGSGTAIVNGTSNVDIATANANITMSVDGVSNVVVVSTDGITVAGNVIGNGIAITTVSNTAPVNPEQGDIWINTDNGTQYIYFSAGGNSQWAEMEAATSISIGSGAVDLSAVDQDIIPSANATYSLGNATNRWANLFLVGNTIYLGEASISSDGESLQLPAQVAIGTATLSSDGSSLQLPAQVAIGTATIDGSSGGIVLPANSTVGGAAVATPRISSLDYPGNDTAADPAGGQTIGIVGTGFQNGASVIVDGTTASVVTFVSDARLEFTSSAKATGSYALYVINPDGGTGIFVPGMQYSGTPTWSSPAAGSLGEIYETQSISNTFVATSDSAVTYSLQSGTLPPGSTLNGSTGTLTGTANLTAGNPVTYNFTIRATDAEQQDTDRSFSLTIDPDVITWVSPSDGSDIIVVADEASTTVLDATSAAGDTIDYSANTLPTGLSLSGNTITGTATVVGNTSVSLTATGNTTTRSATISVTFVVELGGDPYFAYTTLLLSADSGPTFISDASTNNFAITPNGDTRPSAFSPYNSNWSNYFDGNGDFLSLADNAALDLGTGTFTVEAWVYRNGLGSGTATNYESIIGGNASGSPAWNLYNNQTNNKIVWFGNDSALRETTNTISNNAWNHVAVSRDSSNVLRIFINGVQGYSATVTTNYTINAGGLRIGYDVGANRYWFGYLSNVRVVKGTAVYTADFTPPTQPLTAISGTSLLTCQSNRLIDNSANNFTITKNGDVQVTAFGPFTETDTATGSGYFDGTGDYLNGVSSSSLAFGTGDFTVEGWVYIVGTNTFTVEKGWLQISASAGGLSSSYTGGIALGFLNGGMYWIVNSVAGSTSGNPPSLNSWNHIAITRQSGSVRGFLNGTQVFTSTNNTDLTANNLVIGGYYNTSYLFDGYVSNVRIVKGTAVYTEAFTPPASPLTAISNTSLLTLQNSISYNNSQFVDDSGINNLITRNGNTTQGTFTPFSKPDGAWGNYFDGTGDFISTPGDNSLVLDGNFTIEFFMYLNSISTMGVMSSNDSSFLNDAFAVIVDQTQAPDKIGFFDRAMSSAPVLTSSTTIEANKWYHVAFVRDSGNMKLYLDGVEEDTYTSNNTVTLNGGSTPLFRIGQYWNGDLNGYLSNVRVVKGTAVYTSAFTPPTTPLTAISGTSLLTCQSNRFKDNSSNNFAITRNGDVKVTPFSPFPITTAYDPAVNGGAGYFDGSGDYLTVADNAAFAVGSGNFTAEAWVYPTASPNQPIIMGQWDGVGGGTGLSWVLILSNNSSRNLRFIVSTDGSNAIGDTTSSSPLALNAWNHVALVRNGNVFTIYLNGAAATGGSYTISAGASLFNATNVLSIGASSGGTQPFQGYISNARFVVGTAVYTAAFTPPAAPLTAITNTVLLTNFTNAGIFDNTGFNALETVGNAQIDTSVKKYGTGSMKFDGTTDYVVQPTSDNYGYGTGNFTIEFWLYLNVVTGNKTIVSNLTSASSTNPHLYMNTSSIRYFTANADRITGGALNTGQWYHIALCRASGSTRLFIDGTQSGSTYSDTNNYGATAPLGIGTYWSSGAPVTTDTLNGYIDDLRITKGIARYTANFTPPDEPFPLF